MKWRTATGVLTIVLLLSAAAGQAAHNEVILKVSEYAGVPRIDWPVSGGVPFAIGKLTDPVALQLVDEDRRPLRLQCQPLARWEDGSIKWLLVDFFADLDANETGRYLLCYGEAKPRDVDTDQPPLTWERVDNGVAIDTGVLRAVISRRLVERVSIRNNQGEWIDVVTEPGEMWVGVNGKRAGRYLASLDEEAEIAVEQQGSNRLCVRVTGWHRSESGERFAPFVLRVHAYAGRPYLRVFHTFVNSDLPERGLITGIGLQVPLAFERKGRISYGGIVRPIESGRGGRLVQTDWNCQQIVHDGEPVVTDKPVQGYLAVQGNGVTTACVLRECAQLFPKELAYRDQTLCVGLWPESSGPLDLRREEYKQSAEWLAFKEQFPKAYAEWIDPGTAKSAGISAHRYSTAVRKGYLNVVAGASALGLARTHEMLWSFLPGEPDQDQVEQLAAAVEEPLLPYVDSHYLDETEVLGRLGWQDCEGFPTVENYCLRKLDWIIRHQNDWSRWWGMIDYGGVRSIYENLRDVHMPGQWLKFLGRHGWHNSEVDIPNHIMYHYLRSGDRRVFHFYESTIRHQMDVDTMHLNLPEFEAPDHEWKSDEWTRGGQHRHSYNHYSGSPNIGHTWCEGLVNYYFLTGDRRAYDVALEVGEYSLGAPVGKVQSYFDKYALHENPIHHFSRSPSNSYRNCLKCYEMTGDPKWKKEALRYRQHFLDHSPDYLDQQSATFHVTNYLVRTMAADYHILRDPRMAEELVRIARWHCDFMKRGKDQRGLHYPYLACGLAWWISRDDDLLRWPWHTYLDECRSPKAKAQNPGDFNQSHFFELGQLPFFLRACHEAGFAEASPPAPPQAANE